MKRCTISLTAAALLALCGAAWAQAPADTTAAAPDTVAAPPAAAPAVTAAAEPATPPASTKPSLKERMYYGGSIGFSFWDDYFRISLEPLVAIKVKPKLSIGGKLRYEYLKDNRGAVDYDAHNYGASVFSRYRLLPVLYAHGELATMSYDYPTGRESVPFLLVGGGISKPLRPNVWGYVEVLWDVLDDDNNPYDSSQPFISVGVGVGF